MKQAIWKKVSFGAAAVAAAIAVSAAPVAALLISSPA
jgi:hypothetical protein